MYNHVAEVSVYVFMQFLRSVFFALLQPNYSRTTEKLNAGVAQLVAHYVRDVGVGRSSRLIPTL